VTTILFIAPLVVAVVVICAKRHIDRIKDGHNVKLRHAIDIYALFSIFAVVVALFIQYNSSKRATELRVAQTRLSVLEGLSSYHFEMLDSYFFLLLHSAVTYNFASFEAARNENAGASAASPQWESLVSESLRQELKESRAAFERLQKVSRQVLLQADIHPSIVPKPLIQWAQETLTMQFTDVARIVNLYQVTPESQTYVRLLGQAIGVVIGETANAAEKFTQ
jgi:hypothetical protein